MKRGRTQRARVQGVGRGVGGLAALGGQGVGTEKRGEEAVQQSERKEA